MRQFDSNPHRGRPRHPRGVAVLLCLLAAVPAARAVTPATLLDPQLNRVPINLAGMAEGTLSYFDDQRRLTQAPVDQFVRLTFSGSEPAAPAEDFSGSSPGVVELVDGQRLAGRWAGARADGEALLWEHTTLGRFTLGLDDVRRVALTPEAATRWADPATPAGDTVRLRNGDELVGFVVALTDDAVSILPDGADQEVELDAANIAELVLSNPVLGPAEIPVTGDLVVLHDGSRVRGRGLEIQRQTLGFKPALSDADQRVDLEVTQLRRIDFVASGLRLVELASRPLETVDGGTVFGIDHPPRRDAAGIHLHAPVTVSVDLPDGARRLAATAVLDLPADLPPGRAALADLALEINGQAALGLRHDQPRAELNVDLDPAQGLHLRVDPAAHGPILDRLRLQDAVLLVGVSDPRPDTDDPDR